MDLASLDVSQALDDGIDVDIRHPTTNLPIGLTVRVTGYEGDRAKALRRKNLNEALRNPRHVQTAEEAEARVLRIQVAIVLDWTWSGLTLDGETPDCTPEQVERVLRRFPFIAEQIDAAAGDRSSFLQA